MNEYDHVAEECAREEDERANRRYNAWVKAQEVQGLSLWTEHKGAGYMSDYAPQLVRAVDGALMELSLRVHEHKGMGYATPEILEGD